MRKEQRYKEVLAWFRQHMPVAETELAYKNPFQLLVAVVLSAQCTDKRVNLTTPALFERFPTPQALAEVDAEEIFPYIKSISYPNNKAKHLAGLGSMLVEEFEGKVPESQSELMKLPGVGRKTANVIASVVFQKAAMAVDTHVFRVSQRLGLVYRAKTPLEVEKQLIKHIPEEEVHIAHHWLILHGRYVCKARAPLCDDCGLTPYCAYYQKQQKKLSRETS